MAYRNGAFVMDIREGRIGQVVGGTASRVQLRRPGGGPEWEAPFTELRVATREERQADGLWPSEPVGGLYGCPTCPELEAAWREAKAGGDEVKAGDALVAQRRHWRAHMRAGYVTRRVTGGRA
ncbi:hypothetical protein [Streptomyces albireticuli]|uniref:Uncharacterized protein n=1 Tax=Streptomyces albireticuli TaxID=1940 RepID=A0A2A2CZH2_9ACTN|nr:hypothetical protein [Streptomyces albireticuli]MCD9141559.1 hypothetical protein [Streptomyces albireticuli]MCD9164190.1 hypothetical protein [Streptomyces albireticuli]MCD9189733.1 hypothetical protein [Streptomyces albireticuli]PAU44607.1 hypothetical protein CK936_33960 [Streptomyces albireticuli]